MYVGPKKGRFDVHDTRQSWLSKTRVSLRIGVMVALKRADSAFTITANDGGRAPDAV